MKGHLQPGEEILYTAETSRLTLIPMILAIVTILTVLIAAWAAGWFVTHDPILYLVGGLILLGTFGLILLQQWIVLRSNEYVLTNRRIIKQTGILSKNSVDAYLEKINNVEHRQTLWGRLLGYGDLELDTASESGTSRFPMISNPLAFKSAILAAREQYQAATRTGVAAPVVVTGAERIRQLKALLDDGLISSEEYEAKRKSLIEDI